jgi:hypothetical protein
VSGRSRLGATKRTPVHTSIGGDKQPESPNNLSSYRWTHPLPSPEEELELVRLAKAGDRKAQRQLVANYSRLILGRAGKHKLRREFRGRRGKVHTNGVFDDLVGRGFEALWQAVLNYDESEGPFAAYAKRCIGGQISVEAKTFVKRGSAGETRLERWLFSHPQATPEEMVAAFEKKHVVVSLCDADEAIREFKARCSWHRYEPPGDGEDEPWT